MKKIFLVVVFYIMIPALSFAQIDYYSNKHEANGTGIKYIVDTLNGYITITLDSNSILVNPFMPYDLDKAWGGDYKDASEMVARERDNPKIIRAMREVFSEDEIRAFKESNEKIALGFMYDNDGTVHEVSFGFPQKPLFYSIHPDKWYAWEQKIKEYLTFPIPYEVPDNVRYLSEYLYLWEID